MTKPAMGKLHSYLCSTPQLSTKRISNKLVRFPIGIMRTFPGKLAINQWLNSHDFIIQMEQYYCFVLWVKFLKYLCRLAQPCTAYCIPDLLGPHGLIVRLYNSVFDI
jgi:hypothetical protein